MDLIVASNNKNKIKEYRELLEPYGFNVISLADAGIDIDPEETGETFEENSLIKAKSIAALTDKVVIADDSGLIIDELPDILGVYSKRFMGENTPYIEKFKAIFEMLKGKKRDAHFTCCITLINYEKEPLQFVGICKGTIAEEPEGVSGFGYDPIFIPSGYNHTFAYLGQEIKDKLSHRGLASAKLREYLNKKIA